MKETDNLDSLDLGNGTLADSCKHNNEFPCTINGRNLLMCLGAISFSLMHLFLGSFFLDPENINSKSGGHLEL